MVVFPETISVVIPLYNRREEIMRAISSVLRQSRAADEIVVVDDASRDGSPDVVAAIRDSRIRLLLHERNQGAAAARNAGIAAARGDWIALLDSDDEWNDSKLALQIDSLTTAGDRPSAGVTGYIIHDYRTGEERAFIPQAYDTTLAAIVWGCPLGVGSTLIAQRSVFAKVGPFDEALSRLEDWEWLMRYLRVFRLDALSPPLTIVHKKSNPKGGQVFAATARMRERYRAEWYQRSWLAGRKFDSSLLVEEAAAAHYEGNDCRAGVLALRALGAYPFRPALWSLLTRRALPKR